MDTLESTDLRQRAVTLIQETGALLGMIPELLDKSDELKGNQESVSREAEGLRKEAAALRAEVQQLRVERDDLTDSLTVIMNEILRLASDAVARLRPLERRSSFWREGPGSPGESALAKAATAPSPTWKRNGDGA